MQLSKLTAMGDLEGAAESLEESPALPLPGCACGNPRMPSSGLAPKMSLPAPGRELQGALGKRKGFPGLLRTSSWGWP